MKKMASTFIIVGGTSMLLAQKEMEANYKSIVFALGSGFCMALRNVLKKMGVIVIPTTREEGASKKRNCFRRVERSSSKE